MKHIILLSDGTGNSSAALAKTNVWRLYQALDLREPGPGGIHQIAFYDNGVGTSSFRPLAILGGAFGWGLKRNILELYRFLCQNYEPGDRIFAFGFSRGAFTVRVLVALAIGQGLARYQTEASFARASKDLYRRYRRALGNSTKSPLIPLLRHTRNGLVRIKRKIMGQPYGVHPMVTEPGTTPVAFVGVWDTVAAYGLPSAELTAGFDQVIWPLSMPNYRLSPNVEQARHALALDDQRDAFHPLLWDEVAERDMVSDGTITAGRMRQVWFAGMHSDVGGGYPDDGLAMIPLVWMLREARAAGLRFRPGAVEAHEDAANSSAPMHDSRRGVAGYYRFQPRRIDARTEHPATASLLMRDPRENMQARLTAVHVHRSVIDLISNGANHYAPIVLPAAFEVVDGTQTTDPAEQVDERRMAEQEHVWNDVWRRRVNYFLQVAASAFLAVFPWLPPSYSGAPCADLTCGLAPLITAAGGFLPALLAPWITAFARNPDLFLLTVAAIVLLQVRGSALRAAIEDRMWWIWHGERQDAPPRRPTAIPTEALIERIRTARPYQETLRFLKWHALPMVFGYLLLASLVLVPIGIGYRLHLARAEASGAICSLGRPAPVADPVLAGTTLFTTNAICWDARQTVQVGRRYRVVMEVLTPWTDQDIRTDPRGFWTSHFPFLLRPWALAGKRSYDGKWFQPFVTIVERGSDRRVAIPLDMKSRIDGRFEAVFEAPVSGTTFLWVNDAMIGALGLTGDFYANNHGTARVTFERD